MISDKNSIVLCRQGSETIASVVDASFVSVEHRFLELLAQKQHEEEL